MTEFWDLIVRSNTFNFLILLAILAILWQKLEIDTKLEKMKVDIANFIENSKKERETADKHLASAKTSVENLDTEIQITLEKAKLSAQNVFDEIQDMAQKSIAKIEANVDKIIDNEKRKITTKLSDETISASIERASNKLKEMFTQNPQLHEQYINKSIETLERIKF